MKSCIDVTIQNESYWVVLSCGTLCYAQYKVVLEFDFVDNIQKKATKAAESFSTLLWYCLPYYTRWFLLNFESVGESLLCSHSKLSFFRSSKFAW